MRRTSRLDKANRRPMDPLFRRVTRWNGTIGTSVQPFTGIVQTPAVSSALLRLYFSMQSVRLSHVCGIQLLHLLRINPLFLRSGR